MATAVDRVVHISEEHAQRLTQLAGRRGTTEDALIERALDILFDLNDDSSDDERRSWSTLSMPALERVWDNDADSLYDDWRTLYGLPKG